MMKHNPLTSNIIHLRTEREWTYKQIAEHLGITRSTVAGIVARYAERQRRNPMPIPQEARELPALIEAVGTEITAVDTAIAALPATPLEADLPAIVEIVSSLRTATDNMQSIVSTISHIISTVRINQ